MMAEPPGAGLPDRSQQTLVELLTSARAQHFLGPGDIASHLAHSLAFAGLVPIAPGLAVDLGSGAGVPGLILAVGWPESSWVLLDANARKTEFLRSAVAALKLDDRVEVVVRRAEEAGHDARWRGSADLVVARGFGPPAVTAECAAPLLRVGGTVVVAEPPGGAPDRWPSDGLRLLGLVADGRMVDPVALQRLRLDFETPERYARRVGIPAKRPLF
ncbi:MAG: rRNA (guanine527-N7)-methyltransferase [Acidimicrobiaceae bacterium]|nr:rRNA (guanine527-N7)-methyltransferase [Acidimicrobiaceae bacterium]